MIRQFKSFDPEQAKAMGDAFAAAWKSLKDSDSPATFDGSSGWARKTIALRIIDAAQAGENDVDRLRDDALAFFAVSKNRRQTKLLAGLSWLERVRGREKPPSMEKNGYHKSSA